MRERWKLYMRKADFSAISAKYGIDPVTARIMTNRGVVGDENIRAYLGAKPDDLADPALFKDGLKAAQYIKEAIEKKTLIAIASDFDNDGIFSGLLLKEAITALGGSAEIYTPNRVAEGYGLNSRIVEEAAERGAKMILTCDNGIAAFEAIDEAKSLGLTVIVTDHHEVAYKDTPEGRIYRLPVADAVVDPKQADCGYPFKGLCGTGVALRLMELLCRLMGRELPDRESYLQYTAIATVADVMDLNGENRVLVREGLRLLQKTEHVGLKALMKVCGIEPYSVRAYHIGFILGPSFNAAGRLDTISHALSLLEEKDEQRALYYAQNLADMNSERKDMTNEGVQKATEIIESSEWKNDPVYLVYIPDCHESVAGIIAGRVREKFYRPTLVFTDASGEGLIKASGRSIEDYDMFENLNACRELFVKFGGHKMAAGLTMEASKLEELRLRLNRACTLTAEQLSPVVMIDVAMPLGYISEELIADLGRLEPFGKGNEKPLFARQHLAVCRLARIGKNKNVIKLLLSDTDGRLMDALYFGDADEFISFIVSEYGENELDLALRGYRSSIDIAVTYYPQINEFQGKRSLQIVIQNYCRVRTN